MKRSILLLAMVLTSCQGEDDRQAFEAQVVPLLERHCATSECHGVPQGGTGYQLDASKWLTFPIDGNGRIADTGAALASVKAKINSAEGTALSTFLRKTLPVAQGGVFHFRGNVFPSAQNGDYQTLAGWAATVPDGTEGASEPPLTVLEQEFKDKVYPTLIHKGCATATCHGELNFGVSIFKGPVDLTTLAIDRKDLRETYRNARANLTLWGDPLMSRLIRKMLPQEKGGIAHKGGNDAFFAGAIEQGKDPRESDEIKAIVAWLEDERKADLGAADAQAAKAGSLVVVGGPLPHAGPFEVAPFTPGSDLYRIDAPFMGAPVALTASAHAAPADVRDPAVSHDGKTLAFSMRTSESDAHNIYTIAIDGTGLKQLTNDTSAGDGGLVKANMSPVFGPNGGALAADGGPGPRERIYFVSTRASDLSDDSRYQNADIYVMDTDGGHVERLTYTVVPEAKPSFLSAGEFFGTMAYTIKRSADGGYKGVVFRFPIDHNPAFHIQPEAHPHFGMSEPQQVFYNLREMSDGRSVVTLEDQGNLGRGGQLAVLERQFAVEIPEGSEAEATLPGFRHALTVLTPDASRTGTSTDGLWRDPTPLPDGSIVVAHAAGPIDLSSPAAELRTDLVRLTLTEDRASSRPKVATTEVLQTAPAGSAWSQPVGVFPHAYEDPPHPRGWNDTDTLAKVVHSGVQVIEAVLSRLTPTGPRTLRDDIAFVRAMVPLTVAGPLPVTKVPAEETRAKREGATNLSLTGRMPLFAAVEIPPASDGSLAAFIPAKVPIRVVTLDKDRLAVGTLQHQWYATLPGERFPVGIPESSFSARCAGCHGAMDGKKDTVLQPPTDFVTQASVTAALYDGADRRKPLELPTVVPSMFIMVDFQKDVQPILKTKCASCHTGDKAAAGLTLTDTKTQHYTDAYESLLAPGDGSAHGYAYVDADGYRARESFLAEKIMGREYDAPREMKAPCPPPGAPELTADEKATLVRWIEFGAAFVGVP